MLRRLFASDELRGIQGEYRSIAGHGDAPRGRFGPALEACRKSMTIRAPSRASQGCRVANLRSQRLISTMSSGSMFGATKSSRFARKGSEFLVAEVGSFASDTKRSA